MDTFLPREIYLIIGILIFTFLIFLLFFTDNSKKEGERNQKELNKPNELGKENSVNLNLAITYSEMNQIDKAKELLNKIKLDQLEEEEKNTYQTISQKLKEHAKVCIRHRVYRYFLQRLAKTKKN